jgi:hypothetical protein
MAKNGDIGVNRQAAKTSINERRKSVVAAGIERGKNNINQAK